MSIQALLQKNQAVSNIKQIEVQGETLHVRDMTVAEASEHDKIDNVDDQVWFMFKTCLVDESGNALLTEEDKDNFKTTKNAFGVMLYQEIKTANRVDYDPKG